MSLSGSMNPAAAARALGKLDEPGQELGARLACFGELLAQPMQSGQCALVVALVSLLLLAYFS